MGSASRYVSYESRPDPICSEENGLSPRRELFYWISRPDFPQNPRSTEVFRFKLMLLTFVVFFVIIQPGALTVTGIAKQSTLKIYVRIIQAMGRLLIYQPIAI